MSTLRLVISQTQQGGSTANRRSTTQNPGVDLRDCQVYFKRTQR